MKYHKSIPIVFLSLFYRILCPVIHQLWNQWHYLFLDMALYGHPVIRDCYL